MKKMLCSFVAALCVMPVFAAQPDDIAAAKSEWSAYAEQFPPIGERLVAKMEDADDPLLRRELYKLTFAGMSAAYLALLQADPQYPDLWPVLNMAYNFYAPNPDDLYLASPIDPTGVYQVSGYRGTVRIVDFTIDNSPLVSHGVGGLGATLANYDIDKVVHVNKKDGSFSFIISGERPKGYKGDWLYLHPKTTYFQIRSISYDWLHEVDGRFAIQRLDHPAIKPRLTVQEIDEKLKMVPQFAENWTEYVIPWLKKLRDQIGVNNIVVHGLDEYGGLTTQKYIEGLFEIEPDEALIYETEVPKQCRYWNIELTDMLWSAIDYMNRQSTLNGYTARLDKDGKFRAVVSGTDPGVPNWLDSAGYRKGVFFGRWKECSSAPTPKVTKVKLADVRKYLPADTPVVSAEERDEYLRLRRKGAQMRRRW